jgi:FdhE protein
LSEVALTGGGALGEVPYLRPRLRPAEAVFARRAERFAALAPGHPAGDYLAFLARLAAAQRAAASRLGPVAWPASGTALPLDAAGPWPARWQAALELILDGLSAETSPGVRAALAALAATPAAAREAQARRLLAGESPAEELAVGPFLGAALQVVFTAAADGVDPSRVERAEIGCPVCGSAPTVGMILGDDKLRYLVCGLCATEWHRTRLQCVLCRSGAQVSYLVVEGAPGGAKAEACEGCRAWLKLLYVEQAPRLEPLADDVATLALDLLVAEQGLDRLGRNLLLVHAAGSG